MNGDVMCHVKVNPLVALSDNKMLGGNIRVLRQEDVWRSGGIAIAHILNLTPVLDGGEH
jgi:hypothetical protein